jgi:hypothetical protein
MKEFKKFVNSEASKRCAEEAKKNGMNIPEEACGKKDFDPKDIDMVKELADKYKDNKEMLVSDIVKLAAKNKKEGKINDEQLSDFEKKLAPMLNDKQKKMLENIMGMIKDK